MQKGNRKTLQIQILLVKNKYKFVQNVAEKFTANIEIFRNINIFGKSNGNIGKIFGSQFETNEQIWGKNLAKHKYCPDIGQP